MEGGQRLNLQPAIPVQLLHTISCLARCQDIAENWAESESGDIFGGRECRLRVSRCVQTRNMIFCVFVTPSFPDHLLVYSLSHLYG